MLSIKKKVQEGYSKYYNYSASDMMVLAALRAARKRAGLTQVELADRLYLSCSYINLIEAGKAGKNWLRYMPKTMAWLNACGVSARIELTVIADSTEKRKKLAKKYK